MLGTDVRFHEISNRSWLFVLGAGLLLLLVVRVLALYANGTDLFFDEAQYWAWSEEPAFGYYSKPPVIAWMIRAATETCGVSEFCVRLPSPLLHTLTALFVFLIGWRLYSVAVGVLSALAFATLPGVSVSSGIISTDVPLLVFWALALFALASFFETKKWWPALLLGFALGAGLNAKYAMAWFGVCVAFYLAVTPSRRWILTDVRLWIAVLIGVLMIIPNVLWNLENKFATFSHTADNAKWGGELVHPLKALEFFGSQFGVFGPILFGGLLVIFWRWYRGSLSETDRLLVAFSLPIIALITLQAFVSRAHPNWAAVAYVAGSVLVVATMVRDLEWPWLRASFGLHVVLLCALVVGTSLAGRVAPFGVDPFARTLGWKGIAEQTGLELAEARQQGRPFAGVITDERPLTAELLYYLRDETTPIYAWRYHVKGKPRDHFELRRPFHGAVGDPVLLVSLLGERSRVKRAFSNARELRQIVVDAGPTKSRRVTFYALTGYKGQ